MKKILIAVIMGSFMGMGTLSASHGVSFRTDFTKLMGSPKNDPVLELISQDNVLFKVDKSLLTSSPAIPMIVQMLEGVLPEGPIPLHFEGQTISEFLTLIATSKYSSPNLTIEQLVDIMRLEDYVEAEDVLYGKTLYDLVAKLTKIDDLNVVFANGRFRSRAEKMVGALLAKKISEKETKWTSDDLKTLFQLPLVPHEVKIAFITALIKDDYFLLAQILLDPADRLAAIRSSLKEHEYASVRDTLLKNYPRLTEENNVSDLRKNVYEAIKDALDINLPGR